MDKKIQDENWASLHKETRAIIRKRYEESVNMGLKISLIDFFGLHNLTSDTEPEEMLMVERKRVQQLYSLYKQYKREERPIVENGFYDGEMNSLKMLFGDKCLPDKEEQAKPKFEVGDKVRMDIGKIGIIVCLDDEGYAEVICDERPYLKQLTVLEPYTEETNKQPNKEANKPMEDKELNLAELLKSCVDDETFYCPMWGETDVVQSSLDGYQITPTGKDRGYLNIGFDGKADEDGEVILYPSRALYEKYPLDGFKAWAEWAQERKPKYEFSGCMYIYKDGETVLEEDLSELTFDSSEEAQQAAEEVRKCLENLHKRKEGEK